MCRGRVDLYPGLDVRPEHFDTLAPGRVGDVPGSGSRTVWATFAAVDADGKATGRPMRKRASPDEAAADGYALGDVERMFLKLA